MDVESYRTQQGLTYKGLAQRFGLGLPVSQMRRIAIGHNWPAPQIIDAMLKGSNGAITVDAMHQRYSAQRSAAA